MGCRPVNMKTFIPLCQVWLWLCSLVKTERHFKTQCLLGLDTHLLLRAKLWEHSRGPNSGSLDSVSSHMLYGSDQTEEVRKDGLIFMRIYTMCSLSNLADFFNTKNRMDNSGTPLQRGFWFVANIISRQNSIWETQR